MANHAHPPTAKNPSTSIAIDDRFGFFIVRSRLLL
jgi:hypothetical protein